MYALQGSVWTAACAYIYPKHLAVQAKLKRFLYHFLSGYSPDNSG